MRCEDKWVCKYGTGEGAEEWAACTQQNEGGWEMRRDQNSHFHFMDKKYDDTQRTRHGRKYWVATFSETILVRRNNWIRHEAWWWWLIRELFVCIFLYGILFYHAHLTFKDGRCAQKPPRKDYRQSLTLLPLLTLMIKKTKQSSMQSLPSYSRCLLIFFFAPYKWDDCDKKNDTQFELTTGLSDGEMRLFLQAGCHLVNNELRNDKEQKGMGGSNAKINNNSRGKNKGTAGL